MKKDPLVSIALLTYNHENYITDCILGLLEQDYSNMELIILDDSSEDRTIKIIKTFENKILDKFVKFTLLENQENSGSIPYNLNCILKQSKGIYFKMISGDDILAPNFISELVQCLINEPQCSIAYSNVYIVEDNYKKGGQVYRKNKLYLNKISQVESKELFYRLMIRNFIAAPSVLIKKEIFEKVGYYDESIPYEDYELWIRIACNGGKFYYLNKCLAYYRKSDTSITNFLNDSKKEKIKLAILSDGKTIKKYLKFLSNEEQLNCIKSYYYHYLKITWETKYWRVFFAIACQLFRRNVRSLFLCQK